MPAPRWLARFNRHVTNRIARTHAGWLPGMGIVHHVGRSSGHAYQTPVLLFRQGEGFVIALTYGADSDWVKNVMAAGSCDLQTRRHRVHCSNPVIRTSEQQDWAPAFIRVVLRLMNVHESMHLDQATESGNVTHNA